MDSQQIKTMAARLGADVCGVADVGRFIDSPKGFHPLDIMAETRSVVVIAKPLSRTAYHSANLVSYTLLRNRILVALDDIAIRMCEEIEATGARALPIPSAEPYQFWDTGLRHGQGILSLKHAAQLAGVGTLGKNTVLLNPRFGNRLWLGAVLTDLKLTPDPMLEKQCLDGCRLCLDACPQGALDGTTIIQRRCRERSFQASEGGGWYYDCCECLQACPNAS